VVDGLKAVHRGLTPFAAQKIGDFATFLGLADEYRRTEIVSPKPILKPASRKPVVAESFALNEAKRRITSVYEHAQTATDEQIEAVLKPLADGFSPAELKRLAQPVGVGEKVKSLRAAAKIVNEIRFAIKDRRDVADRSKE